MTTKLEQAARQALEALEEIAATRYPSNWCEALHDEITALRFALADSAAFSSEALSEQDDGSVCGRCGGIVYDPVFKQAKQEPDYKALWEQMCQRCDELDKELSKYSEQEPVAYVLWDYNNVPSLQWDKPNGDDDVFNELYYAATVRTKDLTDAELAKAADFHELLPQEIYIARAVIAADREKNK